MKLWTDTGSLVLWVTVPCGEDGEEEGRREERRAQVSAILPQNMMWAVHAHSHDRVWSGPCWCPEG